MSELEQQIDNRRAKRSAVAQRGIDPYPRRYEYDLEPAAVHRAYGERTAEELDAEGIKLRVPGRVRALRTHGKIAFIDIHDGAQKLQVFLRRGVLSEEGWWLFDQLDLGDYVGASGTVMRTRTGELTLLADEIVLLSKALRPLPEKWHGLTDVEARYRQRYLDLVMTPESRGVFERRAAIIGYLRRFLDQHGFLEVETPMMHSVAAGAAARPFKTHHNALDLELFLRIAPELHLKRLLVGGLHRVYEINRSFRNEGLSTRHNPEFTMLEFYWAYSDFEQLMDFTEEMISGMAKELLDTPVLEFRGERLDLKRPWARYGMVEALREIGGISGPVLEDQTALRDELVKRGGQAKPGAAWGNLIMDLFEIVVEPRLQQPTFIHSYPVEVSPLAKTVPGDERFAERFELYIGGMELANAFTELNDPDMQRRRFEEQLSARERGDEEAHEIDLDYVTALEFGMPPAGGEGIGIDRLAMLFSDSSSIRDVILFPLMRPRAESEGAEAGETEGAESAEESVDEGG